MFVNAPIPLTGDIRIDALLTANQISFAINRVVGTAAEITYSYSGMSDVQQVAIDQMLAEISAQVGLTFRKVDADGLLQYEFANDLGVMESGGAVSGAAYPTDQGVTVRLNVNVPGIENLTSGYGKFLLLHETGHALGLKHPGIYSSGDTGPVLDKSLATASHTLMAYNGGIADHYGDFDLMALQYLYGGPASAVGVNEITAQRYDHGSVTSGSYFNDRISVDMTQLFNKGIWIYAGPGTDTLTLDVASNQVTFQGDEFGTLVYQAPDGRFASVWTKDVERVQFADTSLALDVTGKAGQAYRLYEAAFDRKPDLGGLGYWIDKLDHGMSLQSMAQGFIDSSEFQAMYGKNPSHTTFVDQLYYNILDRAPDQGGLNYWVGQLQAATLNEAQVLASFSESNENVIALSGVIQNGIEYLPV